MTTPAAVFCLAMVALSTVSATTTTPPVLLVEGVAGFDSLYSDARYAAQNYTSLLSSHVAPHQDSVLISVLSSKSATTSTTGADDLDAAVTGDTPGTTYDLTLIVEEEFTYTRPDSGRRIGWPSYSMMSVQIKHNTFTLSATDSTEEVYTVVSSTAQPRFHVVDPLNNSVYVNERLHHLAELAVEHLNILLPLRGVTADSGTGDEVQVLVDYVRADASIFNADVDGVDDIDNSSNVYMVSVIFVSTCSQQTCVVKLDDSGVEIEQIKHFGMATMSLGLYSHTAGEIDNPIYSTIDDSTGVGSQWRVIQVFSDAMFPSSSSPSADSPVECDHTHDHDHDHNQYREGMSTGGVFTVSLFCILFSSIAGYVAGKRGLTLEVFKLSSCSFKFGEKFGNMSSGSSYERNDGKQSSSSSGGGNSLELSNGNSNSSSRGGSGSGSGGGLDMRTLTGVNPSAGRGEVVSKAKDIDYDSSSDTEHI